MNAKLQRQVTQSYACPRLFLKLMRAMKSIWRRMHVGEILWRGKGAACAHNRTPTWPILYGH